LPGALLSRALPSFFFLVRSLERFGGRSSLSAHVPSCCKLWIPFFRLFCAAYSRLFPPLLGPSPFLRTSRSGISRWLVQRHFFKSRATHPPTPSPLDRLPCSTRDRGAFHLLFLVYRWSLFICSLKFFPRPDPSPPLHDSLASSGSPRADAVSSHL